MWETLFGMAKIPNHESRDESKWSVPECAQLMDEYVRRKEAYGVTVDRLFAIGYRLADPEYRKLKASTEAARFNLEAAAFRLEMHQRLHLKRVV
jgi:hypothetical protein